ncbi:hypothetical protein [Psychroserpens algicola]|uniref:Apea-like HEPN domain-containing protein n=1 Tax=Psychroserpens algicola TaxID=1719034 RepID=A0ABT0H3X3_9FLAO|nr:hypothetical protein [Psychroserpens algicola]MCK8479066.1 hypothetical protein [Psychroserpens algicola]
MIINDWVKKNENDLSNDSRVLFKEANLCYKIEAFKASLLFSYLGLFTIIKEKIISSKKPDPIPQGRWNNILKELNDEDAWEKRVFDELVNSSSGIFNISETIRQQIKFWKDRRNDCAHSKQNEINVHHVEMFWSFFRSNLSKITIEGGRQSLYNNFRDHFDDTMTAPNQDYSHLIAEIEFAVEKNEWKDFFLELFLVADGHHKFYDISRVVDICKNTLLQIKNDEIINSLIYVIKNNPHDELLDLYLISKKPQFIHIMNYSKKDIRSIWKQRMWVDRNLSNLIFPTLLRNNLIPRDEIEEAIKTFYDKFDQSSFNNLPSDPEIRNIIFSKSLEKHIFDDFFKDGCDPFNQNDFNYINSKADLITLLIEKGEINEKVVKGIVSIYKKKNNPWWLTDSLHDLLKKNEPVKEEIKRVIDKCGVQFPKQFNL